MPIDKASSKLHVAQLSCSGPDGIGNVVWCDACEARHHHGGYFAEGLPLSSRCHDGPRSPYRTTYSASASGLIDASDGVSPAAGFKRPYWQRIRAKSDELLSIHAAAILGRARRTSFDVLRLAGEEIRLQRHEWQAIGAMSVTRGHDLLTLGSHVHRLAPPFPAEAGLRPGMIAARCLEASTGALFDATAFLGIVEVVDDFYRRGAPYGEGRRA